MAVYGYTRLVTQPTADFRAINSEYTPQEVTKQRYTVDLKIFGGSFQIDRVLAEVGGLVDEVDLQMQQKVKAAKALFHDTVINGDSATNANAFDGLDKAVAGSSTEVNVGSVLDLSTAAAMDTNWKEFIDLLDEFLATLDGKPACLAMNGKMKSKIRAAARRAGYFTQSEDAFGRKVDEYDGIPLVDLGDKPGTTAPVVGIKNRTVGGTETTGLTDIYAMRFGLDGFHAVSLKGQPLVKTWLPDFSTPGAVKTGEVEMVAAIVLKATKAAGVLRNLKVS
jgi:hypothetical protein